MSTVAFAAPLERAVSRRLMHREFSVQWASENSALAFAGV